MNGRPRGGSLNVLRLLAGYVVLAALIGLLSAGLAIPAVGAVGGLTKSSVTAFDNLPSQLTQSPLSQQSRILDAAGNVIATPYSQDRIILGSLAQVAPIMQKAQVAIEDSRFYEHGPIDFRGLSRAVVSTMSGDTQGASTLTQQFVKLTLQENALNADNAAAAQAAVARNGLAGITRKLQELRYAIGLEQKYTKDQILLGYLNLAYYGDRTYGVEAASEHYFSIPASKLNYLQAAVLAGTVQRPGDTDPVNYPTAAFERRNVVLDRMAVLGVITPAQAAAGKKVPIASMLHLKAPQNTCQRSSEPYFCEYVISWLERQPALGKDVAERLKNINTGGLTITTSLKPGLSQQIRQILARRVSVADGSGVGSAAVVVEPGTGKVLGMGQTSTFSGFPTSTQINWAVDASDGGSTYGFQFGSTAKLFTLTAALEAGVPENADVYAKAAGPNKAATYTRNENSDSCKDWQDWNVRNDTSWPGGKMPLRTATAQSVNTAFASLTMQVGLCHVLDQMSVMGMHMGNGAPMPKFATEALGAGTVSPLTLASAYATIAANGKYCPPTPVTSIIGPTRKALNLGPSQCKQVVPPGIAAGVADLLTAPLNDPGGTAYGLGIGRPAAGKTGTTDSHVQTWFVGFTPQLATAVWVGTGIGTGKTSIPSQPFSMARHVIGGTYYPEVFGASIAAPDWHDIMSYASQGLPVVPLPTPPDIIKNGDLVAIPSVVGMSPATAMAVLQAAGFQPSIAGTMDSPIPAGLVAGTNPSGQALRGSNVGLLLSTGSVPPTTPPPTTTSTPPAKTTTTPSANVSSTSSGKPVKGKH